MNINEAFPSRFLKAADLDGDNAMLVIEKVWVEEIGRDRVAKPLLRFRGVPKPMVLNRTNGQVLAKLYGPDTDAWPGKPVTLCTLPVEVAGETHDAIRIRSYRPAAGAAAPAARPTASAKAASQAPLPEPPQPEAGDPGPWGIADSEIGF